MKARYRRGSHSNEVMLSEFQEGVAEEAKETREPCRGKMLMSRERKLEKGSAGAEERRDHTKQFATEDASEPQLEQGLRE